MALVTNPNIYSVDDVVDGITPHSDCGCGCNGAGTCKDTVGLSGMGVTSCDDYGNCEDQLPYPTLAQTANPSYSWNDVFKDSFKTGTKVFYDIYGGPQPGTSITKSQYGSTYQRLPDNAVGGFNLTGNTAMGSISSFLPYLLIGGILFIGVKAVSK